jgi:hypothetical protein
MTTIQTIQLDLLDTHHQPAAAIPMQPTPAGVIGQFYLLPYFQCTPPGPVIIECHISIINHPMFWFFPSPAFSKGFLINSQAVQPIPLSIRALVDYHTNPNYPFLDILCETRQHQSGQPFYQANFQYNVQ